MESLTILTVIIWVARFVLCVPESIRKVYIFFKSQVCSNYLRFVLLGPSNEEAPGYNLAVLGKRGNETSGAALFSPKMTLAPKAVLSDFKLHRSVEYVCKHSLRTKILVIVSLLGHMEMKSGVS